MSTTLPSPLSSIGAGASAGNEAAPHVVLWGLTNAIVPSVSLHLVAELGIADHIADGSVAVATLAHRCGVDPEALDRILALLAAYGIFRREEAGYAHTPASSLLRSDHLGSMRAFPRMMALPLITSVFARLEHTLRTGKPAVEAIEPHGFWAYLHDHPDEAQIFGQAMGAKANADIAAVLGAYDFGRFSTVADIGGGRGHLLRAVLDAVPAAHGILFDLPEVIGSLEIDHERLVPHAGDFFADPLPSADVYLLMEVLHDWPDPQCIEILAAIRRAAAPGAKLLVIENVLTAAGNDPRGHTLDVIMLAVTGGRERTSDELDALFTQAGFSQGTVSETTGPLRIVEATALQ
jgi:C-methyltransferase